ncbi:DUF4062 domain-containing protein [Agrobacterium rhizogenes]|uniref:DUF4062 domain-containing protein n=1 Tax=Rhizobium rhizogenes TaxID=359 RepID=UPI0015738E66|nr:DUF4062 domain-containing protein [Rhizobium rhizogenes]NTI64157.1 DUF4062 domain-containing protein [Rhizobium rhizogenes]
MDVKYQVFVSSTFEDLQDERRAVIAAILAMGHIPVGMEAFNASDEDQWTNIKRRIDKADYYVVIVAERYGAEKDGKSYTQMEYEYAVKQGVPVAAFLLKGEARRSWPNHKVEHSKAEKVETFRKLCQTKMVSFWTSAGDLSGAIVLSLTELIQLKPRVGWVRSDSVPSSNVLNELAALSEEKRQLQAQIDKLTASTELTIPVDVKYRIDQMQMSTVSFIEGFDVEDDIPDLLEVFLNLSNLLARGVESWEIQELLAMHYPKIVDGYRAVERLSAELAAHKLLEVSRHASKNGHTNVYTLTDYGKDLAMYAVHSAVNDHISSNSQSEA